jgi:hypothetical protein
VTGVVRTEQSERPQGASPSTAKFLESGRYAGILIAWEKEDATVVGNLRLTEKPDPPPPLTSLYWLAAGFVIEAGVTTATILLVRRRRRTLTRLKGAAVAL